MTFSFLYDTSTLQDMPIYDKMFFHIRVLFFTFLDITPVFSFMTVTCKKKGKSVPLSLKSIFRNNYFFIFKAFTAAATPAP